MSATLTANGTTFPQATAPVGELEARAAESMQAHLQRSADRSQHLYEALQTLDPTRAGVRRLFTVASVEALAASPAPRDRDVAIVAEHGVYVYDEDSTEPASTSGPRFTIAPTSGAGRWRLAGAGPKAFDVPLGAPIFSGSSVPTAKLEAGGPSGKILQTGVAGGTIHHFIADNVGDAGLSAGDNDRALPQFSAVTPALEVGDIIHYMATVEALIGVGEILGAYIAVTAPDGSRHVAGMQTARPVDGRDQRRGIFLSRVFRATTAGVHKVELCAKTVGLVGTVSFSKGYVVAEVTRPGGA